MMQKYMCQVLSLVPDAWLKIIFYNLNRKYFAHFFFFFLLWWLPFLILLKLLICYRINEGQ